MKLWPSFHQHRAEYIKPDSFLFIFLPTQPCLLKFCSHTLGICYDSCYFHIMISHQSFNLPDWMQSWISKPISKGVAQMKIIVQVQGNMSQWGLKISPILKCSEYCVVCFVDLFLVSTIFIHSSSLLPEDDHRAQNVLLICMSACRRLRSFCQI